MRQGLGRVLKVFLLTLLTSVSISAHSLRLFINATARETVDINVLSKEPYIHETSVPFRILDIGQYLILYDGVFALFMRLRLRQ